MKIIIVGGGCSGLMCALKAKNDNNEVIVIDKNNIMGKKISVTGNGKANFYNLDINTSKYNTHNVEKLNTLLDNKLLDKILPFLKDLGIDYTVKDNLIYPLSNVAQSVQNALILACKKKNIIFINNTKVNDIIKENNIYSVITGNEEYLCDKLVLSTGGSSYTKFGSTGDSIGLLKEFNIKYYDYLPALTYLIGDKSYKWEGIRVNAALKHLENGKLIKEEVGELQLTKDGISGICVFNLSSKIIRGLNENKKEEIFINFMPSLNNNFTKMYLERCCKLNGYTVCETLEGLINYKLLYALVPSFVDRINDSLNEKGLNLLEETLTNFKFNVTGYGDFDHSQVSSGGISLDEINNNYELNKASNIFVIGEALDADGICGGFNMGFAFISGFVCGEYISKGDV